jgi:hypothetical protein
MRKIIVFILILFFTIPAFGMSDSKLSEILSGRTFESTDRVYKVKFPIFYEEELTGYLVLHTNIDREIPSYVYCEIDDGIIEIKGIISYWYNEFGMIDVPIHYKLIFSHDGKIFYLPVTEQGLDDK